MNKIEKGYLNLNHAEKMESIIQINQTMQGNNQGKKNEVTNGRDSSELKPVNCGR